jgi:hypothetical protein
MLNNTMYQLHPQRNIDAKINAGNGAILERLRTHTNTNTAHRSHLEPKPPENMYIPTNPLPTPSARASCKRTDEAFTD